MNRPAPQTYTRLLAGLRRFRHEVFPPRRAVYEKAAREPQQPFALVIACSDSRIDPELITQSGPGEIFVTRNVGNLVPPYGHTHGAVAAVIEYAVATLGVDEIVVCGHTDCGAMKGLLDSDALADHPATSDWLRNAEAALSIVRSRNATLQEPATLLDLIEENVLLQIMHLQTHPFVAGGLARGTLSIHGWVYDIGHGDVLLYDPVPGRFVSIDEIEATQPVEA
jgi:carbonic anhydrase